MSGKYTQGDWAVDVRQTHRGVHVGNDITCHRDGKHFVIGMVNPTGDYPREEHDANALLFAGSKSLLEALEMCLDEMTGDEKERINVFGVERAIRAARVAIAKAKGES